MTIEIIPTTSDPSLYVQRTALSGVDYVLRFFAVGRECKWYFDLSDADEVPILQGAKVVIGWPLLRLVTDTRRPPGEIYAIDLPASGQVITSPRDPNLDDMNGRVKIAYIT